MKLGDSTINTPFVTLGDNPMHAACDWAHQIARAASDSDIPLKQLPLVVRNCAEYSAIEGHVAFLKSNEAELLKKDNKGLRMHHIATLWAAEQDGPRAYLDAMLLGGKPFEDIAAQLDDGRTPIKELTLLVRLYEVLFMHCRRTDGTRLPTLQLRRMALNGRLSPTPGDPEAVQWRTMAATQSYEALENMWGMPGVDKDVAADAVFGSMRHSLYVGMSSRVSAGAYSNEDATMLINAAEQREKRKSEERLAEIEAGKGGVDNKIMWEILGALMPERVDVSAYAGNIEAGTAAAKRNLASEKKISKTAVVDKGPIAARDAQEKIGKAYRDKTAAGQEKPK